MSDNKKDGKKKEPPKEQAQEVHHHAHVDLGNWWDHWFFKWFLPIGVILQFVDQKKVAENGVKAAGWFKSLLRLAWEKTVDSTGALMDWARYEALVWVRTHAARLFKWTLFIGVICAVIVVIGDVYHIGWLAGIGFAVFGLWVFFWWTVASAIAAMVTAIVEAGASGARFLESVLRRHDIIGAEDGVEKLDGTLLERKIRSALGGFCSVIFSGGLLHYLAPGLSTLIISVGILLAGMAMLSIGIMRQRDFGKGWDVLYTVNLILLVVLVIAALSRFLQPIGDWANGQVWGWAILCGSLALLAWVVAAFLVDCRARDALHRLAVVAVLIGALATLFVAFCQDGKLCGSKTLTTESGEKICGEKEESEKPKRVRTKAYFPRFSGDSFRSNNRTAPDVPWTPPPSKKKASKPKYQARKIVSKGDGLDILRQNSADVDVLLKDN